MPSPERSTLRVRAVAVATAWSDAFGTVELACLPAGLEIRALSLARVDPEWAPAPELRDARVVVAYEQLSEVAPDGALLRVAIDAPPFPFRRLALARLSTERELRIEHAIGERKRLREAGERAAAIVAVPALAWGRVVGLGWGASVAVAAVACVAVVALARSLARRIAFAAAAHEDLREALLSELSAHGARVSGAPREPGPAARRPPAPDEAPAPAPELRPWIVAALGLALASIVVLAGVRELTSARGSTRAASSPDAPPASSVSARAEIPAAPPVAVSVPCRCERAASLAWPEPPRQLAVRVSPREGARPGRGVEVDVVAINDGDVPLREVEVGARLLVRSRDGERLEPRGERAFFWPGEIAPGDAVRWRLSAAADAVEPIDALRPRLGEDGIGPAPADAFAKLLGARARPARLEAARMLAWLRDPRAAAAVAALARDGRDEEATELAELARAASAVVACAPEVEPGAAGARVRVCVDNAGDEVARGLVVRGVSAGTGDAARSWSFPAPEIGPRTGLRVEADVPAPAPDLRLGIGWGVERPASDAR